MTTAKFTSITISLWMAAALTLAGCGGSDAQPGVPCPPSSARAASASAAPLGPASPEALHYVLYEHPTAPRVSPAARHEIEDSAVWIDGRLAGFRATRATEEMDEIGMGKLLDAMGVRHGMVKDAYCAGVATCRSEPGAYCVIQNCK